MKERNKDVPIQTAQRHRINELELQIGKLKSEVEYLENELSLKNKAIQDFKKWQSKVAKYNYRYWFSEGLKLAEEPIDEPLHKDMLQFLVSLDSYDKYKRKIIKLYDVIYKRAKKLKGEEL